MTSTEAQDLARLWDHILIQVYGTSNLASLKHLPPDPEGHALFQIVDAAFTDCNKMSGCVPVHRELVQYLAGWGRDMSQGYHQQGGPIGSRPNHFMRRAFRGFVETLKLAIVSNQLRHLDDNRIMYGCFVVPQWLIDKCLDEAQTNAAYLNKLWDEGGSLARQFVSCNP